MTSSGVLLSIVFGFLGISGLSEKVKNSQFFILCIILSITFGIICVISCLRIIQSDKLNPPGNNGLLLLEDISNGYSERGEQIDYIYNLSASSAKNDSLINRNGTLLRIASISFFLMLLSILFSGYKLI